MAGIIGFEREKKNQISGIITLERIKNNSVAGFANFVIDEYPYSVDEDSKPYNKLK